MKISKNAVAALVLTAVGTASHASISMTFDENFNQRVMNTSTGVLSGTHTGPNLAFSTVTISNPGTTSSTNRLNNNTGAVTDNYAIFPVNNTNPLLTATFNLGSLVAQSIMVTLWASLGSANSAPSISIDGTLQTGAVLGGGGAPGSGNPGSPGGALGTAGQMYTFLFTGSFAAGLHTLVFDQTGSGIRMDDLTLTATGVPEPGALALAGGALALLALSRRGRRKV